MKGTPVIKTTHLSLSGSQTAIVLGPNGQPVSSSTTSFKLEIKQTTIEIADPAAKVAPELVAQAMALPLFGGNGLTLATAAEIKQVCGGQASQRLLSADITRC